MELLQRREELIITVWMNSTGFYNNKLELSNKKKYSDCILTSAEQEELERLHQEKGVVMDIMEEVIRPVSEDPCSERFGRLNSLPQVNCFCPRGGQIQFCIFTGLDSNGQIESSVKSSFPSNSWSTMGSFLNSESLVENKTNVLNSVHEAKCRGKIMANYYGNNNHDGNNELDNNNHHGNNELDNNNHDDNHEHGNNNHDGNHEHDNNNHDGNNEHGNNNHDGNHENNLQHQDNGNNDHDSDNGDSDSDTISLSDPDSMEEEDDTDDDEFPSLIHDKPRLLNFRPDNVYIDNEGNVHINQTIPNDPRLPFCFGQSTHTRPFHLVPEEIRKSCSSSDLQHIQNLHSLGWFLWLMVEGSETAPQEGGNPDIWISQLEKANEYPEYYVEIMRLCWSCTAENFSVVNKKVEDIIREHVNDEDSSGMNDIQTSET